MTKLQAVKAILSKFTVDAEVIHCDYDPAGSSYEYAPKKGDLDTLSALVGREVTEDDLSFYVGSGYMRTHYSPTQALIDEVAL